MVGVLMSRNMEKEQATKSEETGAMHPNYPGRFAVRPTLIGMQ